jgi:predicted RNase H-like HicB family nuclease
MANFEIIIYWSYEDEAFLAEVPELPNLMTHGDTQIEALEAAQDAIKLWLTIAAEEGKEIPKPKGKLMYA